MSGDDDEAADGGGADEADEADEAGEVLLSARGVARRFGRKQVLKEVDLELRAGEWVLLAGGNGSGKTTLLQVLAGVLRPDGGTVDVLGKGHPWVSVEARRALGSMGHEPLLYLDLTLAQNLALKARLHGAREDVGQLQDLARRVGLLQRFYDRAGVFSRGMLQRAQLAMLLLTEPRVMLLDEPWSGLDAGGRELLVEVVEEHRSAGGAVLQATHLVEDLSPLADRGLVLVAGSLKGLE